MALGPGKYDDALTKAREMCGGDACSAILIVVRGNKGHGFSCQTPLSDLLFLPSMLRQIADDMERDIGQRQ